MALNPSWMGSWCLEIREWVNSLSRINKQLTGLSRKWADSCSHPKTQSCWAKPWRVSAGTFRPLPVYRVHSSCSTTYSAISDSQCWIISTRDCPTNPPTGWCPSANPLLSTSTPLPPVSTPLSEMKAWCQQATKSWCSWATSYSFCWPTKKNKLSLWWKESSMAPAQTTIATPKSTLIWCCGLRSTACLMTKMGSHMCFK